MACISFSSNPWQLIKQTRHAAIVEAVGGRSEIGKRRRLWVFDDDIFFPVVLVSCAVCWLCCGLRIVLRTDGGDETCVWCVCLTFAGHVSRLVCAVLVMGYLPGHVSCMCCAGDGIVSRQRISYVPCWLWDCLWLWSRPAT